MDLFLFPEDILKYILSFLDIESSIICLLVCKRLNLLLVGNEGYWKTLCQDHWNGQKLGHQSGETSIYHDTYTLEDRVRNYEYQL
jgi:hypothetical protein